MERKRGRPRGYVVSEETKAVIRSKSKISTNIPVFTPAGEFSSMTAAGVHYGISSSAIAHRCKMGEEQRARGWNSLDSIKDYRAWGFKDPEAIYSAPSARPVGVRTPLGEFRSLYAAGKAHDFSISKIRRLLNSRVPGWEYL